MKFTIIKSCLARFSGTFAVGTPSNIHGVALSYRCAKFGAFVNSVTILTLRDLTNMEAFWRQVDHSMVARGLIRGNLHEFTPYSSDPSSQLCSI